jgi:hypothetical protein
MADYCRRRWRQSAGVGSAISNGASAALSARRELVLTPWRQYAQRALEALRPTWRRMASRGRRRNWPVTTASATSCPGSRPTGAWPMGAATRSACRSAAACASIISTACATRCWPAMDWPSWPPTCVPTISAAGRLQAVLTDYEPVTRFGSHVHACYTPSRVRVPKVRVFLDELRAAEFTPFAAIALIAPCLR